MKANEIRIGNFVTDEFYESFSTIIEVESINEKGINLLIEDDGKWAEISDRWIEPEYKFDLLFGIPLTEEWLLKFGFVKIRGLHLCKGYTINSGEYLVYIDDRGVYLKTNKNIVIKYVNQLQNLYFALTGEELTFKSE